MISKSKKQIIALGFICIFLTIPIWKYTPNNKGVRSVKSVEKEIYSPFYEDNLNKRLFSANYGPIQTYGNGYYKAMASANCSHFILCESYSCYLYRQSSTSPLQTYTKSQVLFAYSISGDGKNVALSDTNKYLYFHNQTSSDPMWTYEADGDILSLAQSYNGSYLVAGSDVGKVYFFNKTGSTPMWTYTVGGDICGATMTPNGEYFAVGCTNNKAYLFNKTGPTPMKTYDIIGEGKDISISDDGNFIAVGTTNYNIYLFNSTSQTNMWNFTAGGSVGSIDISADGDIVVAGSLDDQIYVFNKSSSKPLWNYTTGYVVTTVAISSDGQTIIAGSWDYNAYLFNISGSLMWKFMHDSYTQFVAISRDGKYILTSSAYTYLFYWSPPKFFSLATDASEPDSDGMFNLTWTKSIGADNYSVYHSENYIDDFQEADLVQDGIEELNYSTSNLNGEHYYLVVGCNESGVVKSNNILVNIQIPNYIIHINANWTETNNTYGWCTGSGTKSKPFIIEKIVVDGYQEATCIFIENTKEYFVIRNCTIMNGRCGIKLSNVSNFEIINNTLNNLRGNDGSNGIDGQDDNDGTNGDDVIGICIDACKEFNLTDNKILDLVGGKAGNGGIGKNGSIPGGNGGNGGSVIGISINNSNSFYSSYNIFKNFQGGDGGAGGLGYEGYSGLHNGFGGNGGSGGIGGFVIGISVENSNNSYCIQNIFYNISGGNGGNGGKGGDGQPKPGIWLFILSYGGHGGNGGRGGYTTAIIHQNSINITNYMNALMNFTGSIGGDAGSGGLGEPGVLSPGGDGGYGGDGGNVYGFSYIYSHKINNTWNYFSEFNSGTGGKGGNGGRGSDEAIFLSDVDGYIGGYGGNGGNGGNLTGIYLRDISDVTNYFNYLLNFNCGSGNDAGIGGDGGDGVEDGDGGDGGNGGNAGDSGSLFGIYLTNINNSKNYDNMVTNFTGGFGGSGGNGGNGGIGVDGGFGGSGGNGGDGGHCGIVSGIHSEGSINITNFRNIIFHFKSTFGGNGGNGGDGGTGASDGNAGNGGDGGKAERTSGIYLRDSILTNYSWNNVSYIYNSYGGLGGSVGTGNGTPIAGIDGIDYLGTGIYLILNSFNNEFNKNNISHNSIGICLGSNCDNNVFIDNIIHNNANYGVIIINTSGNCYNNYFHKNNLSNPIGINAYDNGTNTKWDNGTMGNWWHDYAGYDNDDDNIGDIPYNISGENKSQDNFPIWDDGPETIKPDIVFVSPLLNNTQITQSLYTIEVNVTDHHPPTEGNVILYVFNTTYDLLFNVTMAFEANIQWIYEWNNISSYNHMDCILKVQVFDSALNPNMNWSKSMYIKVSISDGPIISDDGGNGGGGGRDDKDEDEFNIITFLISPIGLIITFGIAGCIIIIYIKKSKSYKSSPKEKKRIADL